MKSEPNIDLIISRVLFNEAGSDDMLALHEWLKTDAHREEFLALKEYVSLPAFFPDDIDTRSVFEKMEKQTLAPPPPPARRMSLRRRWLVAASVAVAACLTMAVLILRNGEPVEHYIYTSTDNIQQLTLPDGTSVSLNKNSRLTYTNRFGDDERAVDLEGEAWFDVTGADTYFRVKFHDGEIRVLGTKFNVKANPSENLVVASLEEGRIEFHGGDFRQTMSPGQQLIYDTQLSQYTLQDVDVTLATQWQRQLYRYRSITMEELCDRLETFYGVEITIHQRLSQVKVSGSIDTSREIGYVLDIMKNSLKFDWRQNGDQITIE